MSANSVFIIAEAGVNHGGSLSRALEMVDAAAVAGADAVKFQTFVPEALASRYANKADYQQQTTGADQSQLEMLKGLVLTESDHRALLKRCDAKGIQFLSSPFDSISANFLLCDLKLPRIKLGSGEITNGPLLYQIATSGCQLILSTGMSTIGEIEQALALLACGYTAQSDEPSDEQIAVVLQSEAGCLALTEKVTLLHCTSEYPCPVEAVNLRAMDLLSDRFGLAVGYSDHTEGLAIAQAAVARGAKVIEKHFTLDRNLAGPDHKASIEPEGLCLLVRSVRDIESALGDAEKKPTPGELKNARVARKSLVAAQPIGKGESYSEKNLTVKRPATGRSPMDFWRLLGEPANRDYAEDEVIDP